MRTILHYFKRAIILMIKIIMLFIPKDKNMRLFSAWFGQKYADSSMYIYEYLLEKKKYKVYWYTRNLEVYKKLTSEGKPVIYSKSVKGIWYHIRAKMLVSSIQLADFSPYLLCKCIYFDLDHGFPLKQLGYKIPGASRRYISFDKFSKLFDKYYASAASEFSKNIMCECFDVKPDHVVFCNKPRTDVLFDEKMREGLNEQVEKIKNRQKSDSIYANTSLLRESKTKYA